MKQPQSIDPKEKGFGVSDVARVFVYIISFKWLVQLFSKGEQSISLSIGKSRKNPAKIRDPNSLVVPGIPPKQLVTKGIDRALDEKERKISESFTPE